MNGRLQVALGFVLCSLLTGSAFDSAAAQAKPEGEMRWALYVTLPPVWFDPGEVSGQLTPFWVLYALHDALVKPMPGANTDRAGRMRIISARRLTPAERRDYEEETHE